jgi:BMFP domain-containing protein YqiC
VAKTKASWLDDPLINLAGAGRLMHDELRQRVAALARTMRAEAEDELDQHARDVLDSVVVRLDLVLRRGR